MRNFNTYSIDAVNGLDIIFNDLEIRWWSDLASDNGNIQGVWTNEVNQNIRFDVP